MINPYAPTMHLFGFAVIVVPDHPRMTLAEDVPVSPKVRIEINLWMRSFFGTYCLLEDGQHLINEQDHTLYMNERTLAQFKAHLEADQAAKRSVELAWGSPNRKPWNY